MVTEVSNDFRFTIDRYDDRYDYDLETRAETWSKLPEPRFHVYLPHVCDEWDISGYWAGNYAGLSDQQTAIADLERFIAEATHALGVLRAGDELNAEPSGRSQDDDE
jgi:hypothetical protein